MAGFLIPPWYKPEIPDRCGSSDLLLTFVFGFTMAVTVACFIKALQQTWVIQHKRRMPSAYIVMVWLGILSGVVFSFMAWFYLIGISQPSFQLFFVIVSLWAVQTQCLLQIIINCTMLLMNRRQCMIRVKWLVGIIVGIITVAVYAIWLPTRLQISPTWLQINNVWDRIEKIIFLLMDLSLNSYFMYLVRTHLIVKGLTKYTRLYRFNLFMVTLSISLDIMIIEAMSLPSKVGFLQFQPFAYLIKILIEMKMAELIGKIARVSNPITLGDVDRIASFPTDVECGGGGGGGGNIPPPPPPPPHRHNYHHYSHHHRRRGRAETPDRRDCAATAAAGLGGIVYQGHPNNLPTVTTHIEAAAPHRRDRFSGTHIRVRGRARGGQDAVNGVGGGGGGGTGGREGGRGSDGVASSVSSMTPREGEIVKTTETETGVEHSNVADLDGLAGEEDDDEEEEEEEDDVEGIEDMDDPGGTEDVTEMVHVRRPRGAKVLHWS